jgi:adenine phosphoribosyltransferase
MSIELLQRYIRDIPDYPKPGILFRDITPLLGDSQAWPASIRLLADPFRSRGIQKVAAVEARGFIFGSALALELGCGFVPIRKKGKLPWKTNAASYALEYGTDTLEVHCDAFSPGESVLIVDDLLATGGTVSAVRKLIEGQGALIHGCSFLIELDFLQGRANLPGLAIHSVIHY